MLRIGYDEFSVRDGHQVRLWAPMTLVGARSREGEDVELQTACAHVTLAVSQVQEPPKLRAESRQGPGVTYLSPVAC